MFTKMKLLVEKSENFEPRNTSKVVIDEIVVLVSTAVTIYSTYYIFKAVKKWMMKDKL